MKNTRILKTEKISFLEKAKGKVSKLGSTLMFPISLLAFCSIFLGISFILPSDWFITSFIGTLSGLVFSIFTILVYFAVVSNFHKNKNIYTHINAAIFLFVFIGVQSAFVAILSVFYPEFVSTSGIFGNLGSNTSYDGTVKVMTPISMSMFSVILMATAFIWIDGKLKNKGLFCFFGFLATIILTPLFIIISALLWGVGFVISTIPFGIGTFFYGFINRLLLPFGLHSVFFPTFLYTSAGGTLNIWNEAHDILITSISGDSLIWQFMYSHGIIHLTQSSGTGIFDGTEYIWELVNTTNPAKFSQGFIPIITFVFPMLAITLIIRDGWTEGKKLLALVVMTMMTGVTEMVEFTFVFLNPWLYFLNAVMVGLSFMLTDILNVSNWISTGWVLDLIIFGVIPWLHGFDTNWYYIPLVGIGIGFLYSILYVLIEKFSKDKYKKI